MREAAVVVVISVLIGHAAPAPVKASEQPSSRLSGRQLAEALSILQGRGLKIVYSSELVRPDMRVVTEPKGGSTRQILDEILLPHGLAAKEGPGKVLSIIKRSPSRQGPAPRTPSRVGSIRGEVLDGRTGMPLTDVLVQVQATGQRTFSDELGRFDLPSVPTGPQALIVSLVGYGLLHRDVLVEPDAVAEVSLYLAEGTASYAEQVTVSAAAFRDIEMGVAGQAVLGSRDLMALRGLIADDPFRAMQTLPGVATGDDFRAEFAVRGHGPEHVGMSLDGVDTPLLFHSVRGIEDTGSLALINSEILESAALVPGARPQRLGAHLGAGVEFTTRDGATDALHVRGMLSATAATTVWEGPIGAARRSSWIVSARQSYLDWLLRKIDPDVAGTFGFTDVQAKVTVRPTPRQSFRALFVGGRSLLHEDDDPLGLNSLDRGASRTLIGNLQWQFEVSPALTISQQIYAVDAEYKNRTPAGTLREEGTDRDATWRGRVDWTPNARYRVELGGLAQSLRASRADRTFTQTGPVANVDASGHAAAAAAWMHLQWAPSSRFTVSPGARIDRWGIVDRTAVSPWTLAEWRISPATRVRGGVAIQRQPPSLEQVAMGVPGRELEPEQALSLDAGVERHLGSAWRLSVTAYARDESDRLRFVGGEPFVRDGAIVVTSQPAWDNALDGTARGAAVTLERRSLNGLSGWLAYGYDETELRDEARAETYVSNYDQRHTLNAYAIYRWSNRTSLSSRLRIGSNFPVPGYYRAAGAGYVLADQRNAIRLPGYGRWDLRADRTFTYRRHRLTVFAEVLNILNRRNLGPADASISLITGRVGDLMEELFPLLPSAGLSIEF